MLWQLISYSSISHQQPLHQVGTVMSAILLKAAVNASHIIDKLIINIH